MQKNIAAILALALLGTSIPAIAGSATGQFNVTATVLNNCIVSAADLAFGNYAASTGTAVAANTSLSVTCTAALPYTISLDGGTTTSTVTARAMSDGASHTLSYNLYTSNTFATVFGDGTTGTSTQAGTGTGAPQSLTIYGRIPASQYVYAGSYADRITITVGY